MNNMNNRKKNNAQSVGSDLSERFLRKLMNTSPDLTRGDCRITFEVGRGLLIEGIKSVCDYSDNRIIISTYSRSIIIEGSCLCICRMLQKSIVICGNIMSVSFA